MNGDKSCNHFDSFTHLDHVGAVAQSVIPTIVKPFAPSPTLFEVTRPNLGHAVQPLPFQHAAHGFAPQQPLPFQHAAHGFSIPQQTLPHDHPTQFLAPEQQLPHPSSPHFQQQLQAIQQYQDIPQGQLPLEGEPQASIDQYIQNNQEAFAANFDQSNVIQPVQTDVQIPYHLPQHGGWNVVQQGGLQQDSSGFGQQVFRPSQQLEAPYKK
ncbi:hypothetical protein HUJ04_010753 [Dendroctonus ponderosae]|nr:hypothetical protein HUJ04_010753 [Dendroctonus ponderosae]